MRHHYFLPLLTFATLFTTAGCSGGPDAPDRPKTETVTGKVTYNGSPLVGASVTFSPLDPSGNGASGVTDESGAFTLTTFETGDGAVAGDYSVGVLKQEYIPGDPSYSDSNSPNYGKTPPPEAEGKTKNLIPERYSNPDSSGLSARVVEGDNDVTLDLKD